MIQTDARLKNSIFAAITSVLSVLYFAVPFGWAADLSPKDQSDMAVFLDDIGKSISEFTTLKTDFIQEKEMALFKEKLVIKGRIYLKKPNTIAWHVDSPVRYSVLITDKLIRQWDEDTNKVQEISLARNPIFQNVLNQLTVWFSGEYGSLLSVNSVRRVRNEPLVLEFTPLEKSPARNVIRSITITFRDDRKYLKQIMIRELSGDVTNINFINTHLNVPLDDTVFEIRPVPAHGSRIIKNNGIAFLSTRGQEWKHRLIGSDGVTG